MKIFKSKNSTLIVFILVAFFGTFVYKSFRARTMRERALKNAERGLQAFAEVLLAGNEEDLSKFAETTSKEANGAEAEGEPLPYVAYLAKVKELTAEHGKLGYAGFGSGEWHVGSEDKKTVARFSDVKIGVANAKALFALDIGNIKIVNGRIFITKFAEEPKLVLKESAPTDPGTGAGHDSRTSK